MSPPESERGGKLEREFLWDEKIKKLNKKQLCFWCRIRKKGERLISRTGMKNRRASGGQMRDKYGQTSFDGRVKVFTQIWVAMLLPPTFTRKPAGVLKVSPYRRPSTLKQEHDRQFEHTNLPSPMWRAGEKTFNRLKFFLSQIIRQNDQVKNLSFWNGLSTEKFFPLVFDRRHTSLERAPRVGGESSSDFLKTVK